MSNSIEKILCSAIYYNTTDSYVHQPKNIQTGYVVCGRRHHNCIMLNALLTGRKTTEKDIQGFLTAQDRFVDRKEAADIAYKAGQIKDITDCLISEDLY